MKLKCIGGLANEQIEVVENYYRENDIVRVRALVEFEVATFQENLTTIINSNSIPYHFYKIAMVSFPDKTNLKFLIPDKMSVKDVLCFVLGT